MTTPVTPAATAAAEVARAETLKRFAAERAVATPVACFCGRGLVTTTSGCATCAAEAAATFLAGLFADPVGRTK